MSKKFEHGQFCWHELATHNADGTKSFYEQMFGWKSGSFPMKDGSTYLMFQRGEEGLGGVRTLGKEETNVPSHWLGYVYVDDVDAAATKAQQLSGSIVVPPRDIPEIGRFAVVKDPSGAVVALWKNHETH